MLCDFQSMSNDKFCSFYNSDEKSVSTIQKHTSMSFLNLRGQNPYKMAHIPNPMS
jgi:hypothetical protein